MKNILKEKLSKGERTLGTWLSIGHPDIVEIISQMELDWVLFDTEHGPINVETIQRLLPSMNGTELTPLIRVAFNDATLIKQALDIGAHGVLVPWVNSNRDAELAVKATKYPPDGIRGTGPRRASKYGADKNYLKDANKEIMTITQVETIESVNNLKEILKVKGVDAIFIGPADLAASMGHLGNPEHKEVENVIKEVLEVSKKEKKPVGIMERSINNQDLCEKVKKRINEGFQIVTVGSDYSMIRNAYLEGLGRIKKIKQWKEDSYYG